MFTTNKNRLLLYNSDIIEYDIKAANISIIKEYSLLSDKVIFSIEKLPKEKRVIAVGLEMGKNKSFSKELEKRFNSVIKEFIELNKLDIDYDVISIKRDAVFVANRHIVTTDIGENIKFIPKNHYHAYMKIDAYEFYFGKDSVDIKGLSDSLVHLHYQYTISFLQDIIELLENNNRKRLHFYLKEFVTAYKMKELELGFYRNFDSNSQYSYRYLGNDMRLDEIGLSILDKIDISYNYATIIIPAIKLIS